MPCNCINVAINVIVGQGWQSIVENDIRMYLCTCNRPM